jgi:translation initiation factor 2 beta subunit (eIF-2beta)/eIF-5
VNLLQINSQEKSSDEDLTSTGVVQKNGEGKLHFIHRSFAEYCVAGFLVNQLTKVSNTSQQVQDLLLQEVFLQEDYRLVRAFIDGLLSGSVPSEEVLKQYGNRLRDLRRDGAPILCKAAREVNAHITAFLSNSLQAAGHTDTVNELVLAWDDYGRTVRHLAAEWGNIQALLLLLLFTLFLLLTF